MISLQDIKERFLPLLVLVVDVSCFLSVVLLEVSLVSMYSAAIVNKFNQLILIRITESDQIKYLSKNILNYSLLAQKNFC